MHVTDLIPTLAAAANISIQAGYLDGVNQWEMISAGEPSKRTEVLFNIENVLGYSAIMHDGWKLVNGSERMDYAGWIGASGSENLNVSMRSYGQQVMQSEAAKSLPSLYGELIRRLRTEATVKCSEVSVSCDPMKAPCLFNIIDDPCEQNNLAEANQDKVEFLLERLGMQYSAMVPTRRKLTDPRCDPANFNNTWTWWEEDERTDDDDMRLRNIFVFSLCGLSIVVVLVAIWMSKRQKRSMFTIRN